jgi:hypothetical protein
MKKHHRIFNKDAVQKKRVLGSNQPGIREWITILATICADDSWLPPAIIFAGKTGNIQTTWVEDVELGQHQACFGSSPNGWTNDKLGLAWLKQVFDKHTKKKASNGREWRLLLVDGHGSHINMNFLDWCEKHHILVAVYPPHTTHRLQPLDVSLFAPLATYYSNSLEEFTQQTASISGLGKRDFFSLFWPAYTKAFTPSNIASGWRKTGLFPFDPEVVLSKLTSNKDSTKDELMRPSSKQSSGSSALSSISLRAVRKLVLEVSNDQRSKQVRKLENTIYHLNSKIAILTRENKNLTYTVKHEKKRRKRGKALIPQFRALEGEGAIFFSPTKIQQARQLEAQREAKKEAEQAAKQVAKEEQQQIKIAKQEEAIQKKQHREEQRVKKQADQAIAKAQKEQSKHTQKANQQLDNEYQASVKKPKRQKHLPVAPLPPPVFHNIEVDAGPPNPASSRPTRIKRQPRHLEAYQIEL